MVAFSNDVEHAAPVVSAGENGGSIINNRRSSIEEAKANNPNLTKSEKAWDLDGDGELDEAELALKALDKSHRGTLTKDEMYKLMQENLSSQRELFKMKKVVMG